jgi:hypothetical protein
MVTKNLRLGFPICNMGHYEETSRAGPLTSSQKHCYWTHLDKLLTSLSLLSFCVSWSLVPMKSLY